MLRVTYNPYLVM